jgi:hypothetical protein
MRFFRLLPPRGVYLLKADCRDVLGIEAEQVIALSVGDGPSGFD